MGGETASEVGAVFLTAGLFTHPVTPCLKGRGNHACGQPDDRSEMKDLAAAMGLGSAMRLTRAEPTMAASAILATAAT